MLAAQVEAPRPAEAPSAGIAGEHRVPSTHSAWDQRCITSCRIVNLSASFLCYRLVEPSPFSLLGWGGPSHKYNKCRWRPRLLLYRRCCGPDIHNLKGLWGPNCYSTRRL